MKKCALLLLISALPFGAQAAGSWQATRAGGQLQVGGQLLTTPELRAPRALPPAASVTQLSWRITLLRAAPPGLGIKLCSVDRCLRLEGLQGTLRPGPHFAAAGPFRFVYSVATKGALLPQVQIVSNQLTVNYR